MNKHRFGTFLLILSILAALTIADCSKSTSNAVASTADASTTKLLSVYFPRAVQDQAPVLAGIYDKATKSIDVAAYSSTHPKIVKALVDTHKRDVKVRVLTDSQQAAGNTQKHAMNTLKLVGVPIKVNTHTGLMHLKMSVIDGQTATTGSYNYTNSASERNDEMFVVSQDPAFVKACQDEFNGCGPIPKTSKT